jgi:hypothetical protein
MACLDRTCLEAGNGGSPVKLHEKEGIPDSGLSDHEMDAGFRNAPKASLSSPIDLD